MSDLDRCKFCGSEGVLNVIEPHKHYFVNMPDYDGGAFVECSNCTAAVSGRTAEEAIANWNRCPEPRQLTLDELRERVRKPIWFSEIGGYNISRYDIVEGFKWSSMQTLIGENVPIENYGKTWAAYDRPPGGEES